MCENQRKMETKIAKYKSRLVLGLSMKQLPEETCVKVWSFSSIITEVNGLWGLSLFKCLSIVGFIIWQQCSKLWKKAQLENIGHMMHVLGNIYLVPILLFRVCYGPCHAVQLCLGLKEIDTANHGQKNDDCEPTYTIIPLNTLCWVPFARMQLATISNSPS